MKRCVLAVLLFCACGEAGGDLPSTFTLTAPGITVEVTRKPYGFVVKNAAGEVTLSTLGDDTTDGWAPIAWTTGTIELKPGLTPGYLLKQQALDPWRQRFKIVHAPVISGDRLEVVLKGDDVSTRVRVVHQLRGSTLRIEARLEGDAQPRAWGASFGSADTNEAFLGFGERFNRTNQRGRTVYSWAEEGGIGQAEGSEPGPGNPLPSGEVISYYPVPFFVSTNRYGFWLDSTWWNVYDLATERPDAWRVWHIGPTLAYEIYVPIPDDVRPWPYHVIDLFTERTGRPMIAPPWTYGPRRRINQQDRQGDKYEIEVMRDLDLAITSMDDAFHYLPYGPSPQQIEITRQSNLRAHALGYRANGYYNSFFATDEDAAIHPDVMYGRENGYFLKNGAGDESIVWFLTGGNIPYSLLLDFTNPDAADWYASLFERALGIGHDGWMYDFGEYVQADVVAWNGMTGEELHNLYPVLYQKTAHDYLESGPRKGDWLTFVRSGYTGASQYSPQVWGGDPAASFESSDGLPSMVRGGVNMGISGVPNWGGDIGGFHCAVDGVGKADSELLVRWIQMGSMTPNMQDQDACTGSDSSRKASIWNAPDAMAAWKTYARLHTRMAPYYVSLGREANQTGAPIMRQPFLEVPDSVALADVDDAYFLGPSLYVAPVVTRGARQREVVFPGGRFVDWRTGKLETAGTRMVDAPLAELPLFLREGHLLPLLDETIDTLNETEGTDIVGPEDVANVYDVVGFVGRNGTSRFRFADGTTLQAQWTSGTGSPDGAVVTTPSTGIRRVRFTTVAGQSGGGGGLAVSSSVPDRAIRWDLYLEE